MIDVHCHLNFEKFENDLDDVVKRAEENGVQKIINTGTQISSSQRAVDLANKYENLYAIVGIHPHHSDKPENGWEEDLIKLGKEKKVVGIGEIGLDYYSYSSNGIVDPELQKDLFIKQIEIAEELNIPLQIHNRQAGEDVIEILKQNKSKLQTLPGMFHCFAGSMEVLKEALNLGFFIGFDGNITYDGIAKGETTDLKDLVRYTPMDRIVTETDSPYLTPEPHRGSRNEPAYVIITGEFIANLKGISFEDFDAQTSKNAHSVFNLNNKL
jgi:TatD DNase family protein